MKQPACLKMLERAQFMAHKRLRERTTGFDLAEVGGSKNAPQKYFGRQKKRRFLAGERASGNRAQNYPPRSTKSETLTYGGGFSFPGRPREVCESRGLTALIEPNWRFRDLRAPRKSLYLKYHARGER